VKKKLPHPPQIQFLLTIVHVHKLYLLTFLLTKNFLQRDAMLARYMPSSCLSVCVSVTLRYCIKMAKDRITQIKPHDSPGTL